MENTPYNIQKLFLSLLQRNNDVVDWVGGVLETKIKTCFDSWIGIYNKGWNWLHHLTYNIYWFSNYKNNYETIRFPKIIIFYSTQIFHVIYEYYGRFNSFEHSLILDRSSLIWIIQYGSLVNAGLFQWTEVKSSEMTQTTRNAVYQDSTKACSK